MTKEETIIHAYRLFNQRNADELLRLMIPDVHWPNGWEGGYVNGRDEVKNYWARQWQEINPTVIPEKCIDLQDGRLEVLVKQTVKDKEGTILFDGPIKHIYTFKNDLIAEMIIVPIN